MMDCPYCQGTGLREFVTCPASSEGEGEVGELVKKLNEISVDARAGTDLRYYLHEGSNTTFGELMLASRQAATLISSLSAQVERMREANKSSLCVLCALISHYADLFDKNMMKDMEFAISANRAALAENPSPDLKTDNS